MKNGTLANRLKKTHSLNLIHNSPHKKSSSPHKLNVSPPTKPRQAYSKSTSPQKTLVRSICESCFLGIKSKQNEMVATVRRRKKQMLQKQVSPPKKLKPKIKNQKNKQYEKKRSSEKQNKKNKPSKKARSEKAMARLIKKIVFIQACWRGAIARKRYKAYKYQRYIDLGQAVNKIQQFSEKQHMPSPANQQEIKQNEVFYKKSIQRLIQRRRSSIQRRFDAQMKLIQQLQQLKQIDSAELSQRMIKLKKWQSRALMQLQQQSEQLNRSCVILSQIVTKNLQDNNFQKKLNDSKNLIQALRQMEFDQKLKQEAGQEQSQELIDTPPKAHRSSPASVSEPKKQVWRGFSAYGNFLQQYLQLLIQYIFREFSQKQIESKINQISELEFLKMIRLKVKQDGRTEPVFTFIPHWDKPLLQNDTFYSFNQSVSELEWPENHSFHSCYQAFLYSLYVAFLEQLNILIQTPQKMSWLKPSPSRYVSPDRHTFTTAYQRTLKIANARLQQQQQWVWQGIWSERRLLQIRGQVSDVCLEIQSRVLEELILQTISQIKL